MTARFGVKIAMLLANLSTLAPAQHDRLVRLDDETAEGRLVQIETGQVSFAVAKGNPITVALDEVQRLELAPPTELPPLPAARGVVWLRSGQVLPATLDRGDNQGVTLALPFATKPITLPWRALAAISFDTDDRSGFAAARLAPADNHDFVFVRHNDTVQRLSVKLLGIEDDQMRVEFDGQARPLQLARVSGLVFGRLHGSAPDPARGVRTTLLLAGGHTVSGRLDELDDHHCRLVLDEGPTLEVPRAQLTTVRFQSDRLLLLTALTPVLEQTPAFDRVPPPLVNHGPAGQPIALGGQTYADGLVVFPRTRLTYDIGGRFDVFEATVGMEDRAGPPANAIFRVLGDGKALFTSTPITKTSPAQAVRVEVTGVARLTLEVDFGADMDLGDLLAIVRARLRR